MVLLTCFCGEKTIRQILPNSQSPSLESISQIQTFQDGIDLLGEKHALSELFYCHSGTSRCISSCPDSPVLSDISKIDVKMGSEIHHFQCQALVFGLASAQRIFTKILSEALAPWRLKAIMIVPYPDDLLLIARSYHQLAEELKEFRIIFDFWAG